MEKTWKPMTAGILSIIAGVVGIGEGSMAVMLANVLSKADWKDLLGKWGAWSGGFAHLPMLGGAFHLGSDIIMGAGIALIVVSILQRYRMISTGRDCIRKREKKRRHFTCCRIFTDKK